jgi:hypothetical protein
MFSTWGIQRAFEIDFAGLSRMGLMRPRADFPDVQAAQDVD